MNLPARNSKLDRGTFGSKGLTSSEFQTKGLTSSALGGVIPGLPAWLENLISSPDVTDVLINSSSDVWVDTASGMRRISVAHAFDVVHLARQLAALCGKRLDNAAPIADGILPNGVRVHAVLGPISSTEALVSLRVSHQSHVNLDQLRHLGFMNGTVYHVLHRIINARLSVFVSGATGSGKTTLLAAMLSRANPRERIICIEEVAELFPDHPHIIHLQERKPNVQGKGHISMSDLVRAAMRMRPDRIVLGECRGNEVKDVLSAMNTGHQGSCATLHANTALDVPARLLALGMGAGMSRPAVSAQASAAIDVVIHVQRTSTANGLPHRYISQIALPALHGENLVMRPALTLKPSLQALAGEALDDLDKLCCIDGSKRGALKELVCTSPHANQHATHTPPTRHPPTSTPRIFPKPAQQPALFHSTTTQYTTPPT